MKKRDEVIRVFLILLILLVYPLHFLVSGITACSNISNSVSLEQSINIQNGTCFTVNANNLYLNGSGFTVTGNTTGSFVLMNDTKNITILNFNARNFSVMFNLTRVNSSLLQYNTVNTTASSGNALLISGFNNNFSSNYLETTDSGGISVDIASQSSNNTFFNNSVRSNFYGFQLTNIQNQSIFSSSIRTTGSSGYGIHLSGTTFNITLQSNNINTSGQSAHGIFINGHSNGSVLLYNVINATGTTSSALFVNGSHTNVSHNYFETRGDNASTINITAPSLNNTFFNNSIFANGTNVFGFYLSNVVNQSLVLNTVRISSTALSSCRGIYLFGNANNNSFVSNVVNLLGTSGCSSVQLHLSRNNTFTSNNFTDSNGVASRLFIIDGSNDTVLSFNILNSSIVDNSNTLYFDDANSVDTNGVTSKFNTFFTYGASEYASAIYVSGSGVGKMLNLNFTSENITTNQSNATQILDSITDLRLNNISFTGLNPTTKLIGFSGSTPSTNVTVSWFVNLSVYLSNGSIGIGAGINITNSTGDSIQFTTADSNGQARFTLTEFIANQSRSNYVSPYNFTINYTGYNSNLTVINLSLTNSTAFMTNLSSAANTSTDPGTSSSGGSTSSSSSTGTTVAPRTSEPAPAETTTATTTEAPTITTTVTGGATAPAISVPPPVIATSLFVNPTTGVPADNLAIIVGDFMPAAEALVLNDIVLSLQQSAVVKSPVQKESFSVETPLLSLQLNNTLGSIKSLITSEELPGVLATSTVSGVGADTKLDQFLNFNSSSDFDSNKVVFEANNQKVPGDYFFARDGQPLFTYTSKFQKGLQSRTNAVSSNASLVDLKDKKIILLGDEYNIGKIEVDTNGSLSNAVSVELLKGGVEGMLNEGENNTYSADGKEYVVKIIVLTSYNEAVVDVNGQTLPKLVIGGSAFTNTGSPFIVRDIIPNVGKKGKSLIRFYVGGKRVLLKDDVLNDTGFTRNALKVNNKQILDTAVRINGFFLDGTDRVVINTIDYELDASSKEGNLYIPAGQTLKQNLKQPDAIFSDNFDMKYNGLKKQPTHPVKFIPEGNNKYYLEFTNQEGLEYKIPLATVESDGNIRYGERSGSNDRNLVFSEGTSNQDFVIQKNDYVLFSDIISKGTLNTAPSFPVFNLGEMTDNFGFSKVLQYNNYDSTNRVLSFTDLAQGTKDNLYYAVADKDNNATLMIEGNQYRIKVNTGDSSLSADLNNDGFINSNFSIASIQGGGLIVFGTKNPKKSSENAALQSINGTLNLTITTLAKRFSSGGSNFRAAFVFEPRAGGKIGFRKNATLGVDFVSAPTKDGNPVSYALDGYGSYYTLINDSSSTSEFLQVDYPENQRTIDFKIEGVPKKEEEVKEVKSLPPDTTKLASQIDKLGQYNSVVVGSPCENPMAAKLLDHPLPCDKDLPEDTALVKIFKYENNNVALLIAGRTPEITKKTVDKITKGEILINLSQTIIVKEPREIEPLTKETEGTVKEKVISS